MSGHRIVCVYDNYYSMARNVWVVTEDGRDMCECASLADADKIVDALGWDQQDDEREF